ncbi:MAG: HD domain-containing protein [Deltaproteobacteria bacterium]|nr:HD domain-containing protein [Deltaproteobacteria bacterium]
MEQETELFLAPDGAELAARVRELIRADSGAILRFASAIAETGQVPQPAIARASSEEVSAIDRLSPDIVRAELTRTLVSRHVHLALQFLHDVGVIAKLLPELEATVDFSQEAGRKHKDVWEHTKQVVRQSVPNPTVRWAALLHDIGKVPTRTFTADGKVHFHGHAEVGARMFDRISRRLGIESPFRQKVRFLILHHLRAGQYSASWTDSAVRRFDREMSENLADLLDLSRADITSKRPGRRQELLRQIHELAERIQTVRELDAKQPPLPTGLGTAISERYGIPPSRKIGELKQALEDAVEEGLLEERRESEYYLEWLDKSGLV